MDIEIKGIDADSNPCYHFYNDYESDQYIEVVVSPKNVVIRWLDQEGNEVEIYRHDMDFIEEMSII